MLNFRRVYIYMYYIQQHLQKKVAILELSCCPASALIRHSSKVRRCKVYAVGKACPSAVVWHEARLEKLNDVSLRGCRVPRMPRRQKLVETYHLPSSLAFWHHLVAGWFDNIISMWQWYIMRHFTSDIKGLRPSCIYWFLMDPVLNYSIFQENTKTKISFLGACPNTLAVDNEGKNPGPLVK